MENLNCSIRLSGVGGICEELKTEFQSAINQTGWWRDHVSSNVIIIWPLASVTSGTLYAAPHRMNTAATIAQPLLAAKLSNQPWKALF